MKAGWRNDDGITGPACHLPFLIPAMKHMLWILKVHSRDRQSSSPNHCRCLPGSVSVAPNPSRSSGFRGCQCEALASRPLPAWNADTTARDATQKVRHILDRS